MSKISIMYLDLSIKGHVLNLKDPCGNLVPYKKENVDNLIKSIQAASKIENKLMRKELSSSIKNSVSYKLYSKDHFSIKLSILLLDDYDFSFSNQYNEYVNLEDIKKALVNSKFRQDPHGGGGDYFIFSNDHVIFNYIDDRSSPKQTWLSEMKSYVIDYDKGRFIIIIDGQKYTLSNYLNSPKLENDDIFGSMAYQEFTTECGL